MINRRDAVPSYSPTIMTLTLLDALQLCCGDTASPTRVEGCCLHLLSGPESAGHS